MEYRAKKATEKLIKVLDKIDAKIKYLENSPHRAFVLIEYDTILLFHWFNLYFNYYWDWFDHDSASQLFKYMEILKRFSEMCDRYEKMLREQYDYLKSKVNFENKFVDIFPPEIFSEESKENYTQYYQNYLGELYGGKLDTLYQISESTWEAFQIRYERLAHHTNYYELRCDLFYDWHAKALVNTYHCLEMLIFLIKGARSYPQTRTVFYMPSQEEIIKTLETDLCQYAKEKGMIVERDLQKTAQLLKPSRNELLDSKIWGTVMEREDDFYDLAISNQLEDNKEKRFEFIDKEQRKQLTENALLLKTIKSNAIDGELFDIRLSVENYNLISSLKADNLNLFYKLILRRNIIQREMYPEKLEAKYEEWLNPSEEHQSDEGENARLSSPLPDELATEVAMKYWEQLKQKKFVDDHYKLKNTTRQQAAYIAELFAEKLNIKTKWKTFEDFWGINNLAQEKNKRLESGKLPSRSSEIDEIFKD